MGCGNDSPILIKKILPNCFYYGIDINMDTISSESIEIADQIKTAKPSEFHKVIEEIPEKFDVVLS